MGRRALTVLCVLSAFASAASVASAHAAEAPNPIRAENALPGTPVGAHASFPANGAIAGYASEISAGAGDTLHFHVSTAGGAAYRVEVYRLGWYGGAGARLIGCTPSCSGTRPGQQLPVPPPDANGLVQPGWPVTDTFTLPANATTGYYRVRFVLPDGRGSSTYVIVRPPAGYQASILVQVPVNTWQAYDTWGGTSLYQIPGQAWEASRVSFDRPYNDNFLGWEYPLVLFLEQQGYDVAYQTDVDTDSDPSSLLGYRLVIVAGHSEYWTSTMRDAFDSARDSGTNLAFMGSNAAYWQIRYENNRHIIVGYKSTADPVTDPKLQTVLFRALTPPRPECELMGIQHQGGSLNWSAGDYTVVPSSLANPWMTGTGFNASSAVRGVVGVETDTIPHMYTADDSCGHELTVFFHREMGGDQLGNADAVAYTAPNGAVVFDAGSKQFSWGLADGSSLSGIGGGLVDPRLQRFVENMLNDLSSTLPSDLAVQLAPDGAAASGGTRRILATITNHGPGSVRVATLDVDLPEGVRFVRVSANGLRCTVSPLSCTLGPFPAGATLTAVFVVRPGPSRRPIAIDANIASAQAHDPDAADARARLLLGAPRR